MIGEREPSVRLWVSIRYHKDTPHRTFISVALLERNRFPMLRTALTISCDVTHRYVAKKFSLWARHASPNTKCSSRCLNAVARIARLSSAADENSHSRTMPNVASPQEIGEPRQQTGKPNESTVSRAFPDVPNNGTREQRGLTNDLNGSQAFYDLRWDENFRNLRAFFQTSGQSDMRSLPKDKRLRMWVSRQKLEYKKKCKGQPTMMTDERVELLKSIGFSFDAIRERSWDKVYQKLCDHVQRNGGVFPYESEDGDALDAEGRRLSMWCQHQRVNYSFYRSMGESRRSTLMTEERIAKLDAINFSWSLRDSFWDDKYEELKAYRRHHGDCLVPAAYVANMSLSKWVERQRTAYALLKEGKTTRMTQHRLALLNELDFVWDANEYKWQLKYKELAEYQSNNGYGALPRQNDPGMAPLYRWVVYQRNAYKKWVKGEKSSLNSGRVALLDQLGIHWAE
jgi:glycerol-3-phosphate cytidylyltransferase-like family protein